METKEINFETILIREGVEKAIEYLKKNYEIDSENDKTLLIKHSEFVRFQTENRNGSISKENYNLAIAGIKKSLIDIYDYVKNGKIE